MANLTRAQIIEALKCCISSKTTDECSKNNCPCYDKWCGCVLEEDELLKLALKELESEDRRTSKVVDETLRAFVNDIENYVDFSSGSDYDICSSIERHLEDYLSDSKPEDV